MAKQDRPKDADSAQTSQTDGPGGATGQLDQLLRENTALLMESRMRTQDNHEAFAQGDDALRDTQERLRKQIAKEQDPYQLRRLEAAYEIICRRRATCSQGHALATETLDHFPLTPLPDAEEPPPDELDGLLQPPEAPANG